jgi:hypothetical protein
MASEVRHMAHWWQQDPIRLVQTNLREIDARRDPAEIVREVKAFGANAILFSVGGIVSFYPTELDFQTRTPYLEGDFVGQAIRQAHDLGLRFIARLDLSKCHRHVYESHPEWFFRRADGRPQVYNGLYSTCINGGYYRRCAFDIMGEILARYNVDGFFFNMFGYQTRDYSGNYHGLCQCVNCQARFRELFGRAIPETEDPDDLAWLDHARFREITTDEVAQSIADFIHDSRDNVAFLTYTMRHVDIVRSESNSAVDRPLPIWQYSGSDNVKRVRSTYPAKPVCNAAVYFVDIPYRFASVSPHLTALRLAQDMAYGGALDLYVLGTLQQEDRIALQPAQEIFSFFADHQRLYQSLASLAQVCLLLPSQSYRYGKSAVSAYRGMFRLLSENHVLFDCADGLALAEPGAKEFLAKYDLLVLPAAACLSDAQLQTIDRFVSDGGHVLATGATALYDERGRPRATYGLECLGVDRVNVTRDDLRSAYFRVHDQDRLERLAGTDLIFLDGPYWYTALKEGATTSLTLVPPSTYGPPEKCFIDKIESDLPGMIWYRYGQGQSVYLPWTADSLYYRHSSPGHAKALLSAVSALCPNRQVITNAHPTVEVALYAQGADRWVMNLVNTSGHTSTAFFEPVSMRDIVFKLPHKIETAFSHRLSQALAVWQEGDLYCFRLGQLELFDTIEIEG